MSKTPSSLPAASATRTARQRKSEGSESSVFGHSLAAGLGNTRSANDHETRMHPRPRVPGMRRRSAAGPACLGRVQARPTRRGSMSIEPGIRTDLGNDEYHALTDWLSSTQLKALLPEEYRSGGSQQALDFGSLFHVAVLEPDNLDGYVALDAATIGVKADGSPAQSPTM